MNSFSTHTKMEVRVNNIVQVNDENKSRWIELAQKLWPESEEIELREELLANLKSGKETAFLFQIEGVLVAFINVSIRVDYVEGSEKSPVGYVEGIYVEPEYRDKKIALQLFKKAEKWAINRGCTQMGSDIELENVNSYKFHKKIGFKEANRIICFIKDI